MQLFQVTDTSGARRLGVRRGAQALVLERPAAGIQTTLDLLVAQAERDLDAAKWLADAEREGAFASATWDELRPRLAVPLDPPEVCVVVSHGGAILGYTLANDVSAWDIERDNPLYLPQSKVYDGCFSCGPTIVTPDEVADPYGIEVTMVVARGTTEVFKGTASTSQLKRKLPDLVEWLRKSNDVPTGTVLSTGTGIIQPLGSGLEPGDVVVISSPQLGTLSNPVAFV